MNGRAVDASCLHLSTAAAAAAVAALALAGCAAPEVEGTTPRPASTTDVRVYVGTYTAGESQGIYRLRLDLASGALSAEGEPTPAVNPSWVAMHPDGRSFYAVNETGEGPDAESGAVSSFVVDGATGALTLLDQQPSGGGAPCHLSLDRTGRYLFVANYWGGSVSLYPLGGDGRLGTASAFVQHTGGTREPGRDPGPHGHAIHVTPDNRFVLVADLGRDELMVYRFDAGQGTLLAHDPPAISLGTGAGPRHLAFHPDGRHVFVINELSSTVSLLGYEPGQGTLRMLQTVSTLPADFRGSNQRDEPGASPDVAERVLAEQPRSNTTAEVAVSADGRFLYGSNRGHDSIAIFAVDPATRRLTPIGHQSTLGKRPRNFALDPTGRWLLAANQDSDSIVVFRVDAATGKLTPVGTPFRVPRPVCLEMVALTR